MARINASYWSWMNRINSDWFLTDFHQRRYETFIGFVRDDLEWLKIVYFIYFYIEFNTRIFTSLQQQFQQNSIKSFWVAYTYFY